MIDVSSLMVLVVVMTRLVVMWMMVMLKLGHLLHTISSMILPVHHDMLSLMSSMLIHIESAMGCRGIRGRSGRRRGIVTEGSSPSRRRARTIEVSLSVVLVVLIVERSGPRLVEAVLTICHLMWYSRLRKERIRGQATFAIVISS